ncbi:LysR family transcriptional regulator [Clostridium transplantifaecale]|uniref:LysR family transcriptional regulator n=1 Tax=Clostridium transplantifaecale TaxID=2479838 RepID=UPI000F641F97|nr:LysR family transcriptional regulator [Clostridium transplantifaecale]
MTERKFEYFLSIVELGSITKAAKKNYISQPSMTQFMNRFETSVGIKLFNRETSPITLTKAGEVYLEYAKKRIELENELEQSLSELKRSVSGSIRLGIPLQMQVFLAHKLLPPFLHLYPNIDIHLDDDASPALEKEVLNGQADCALIYAIRQTYKRLSYDYLEDERIRVVCSKNHPLLSGKKTSSDEPFPVRLEELKNQVFCLMDKNFIVRKISDEFFLRYKFVPKYKISMSSMNAILNMVCSGNGISFIPDYVISSYTKAEELGYLEIQEEQFALKLALVYQDDEALSPAARVFIKFVNEFYER